MFNRSHEFAALNRISVPRETDAGTAENCCAEEQAGRGSHDADLMTPQASHVTRAVHYTSGDVLEPGAE
jgi:hypothetical protein